MEVASILTDLKWEIIKSIARKKSSPIELSKNLNASLSNISQQLKLLEFIGLIKKGKISTNEKGKPRPVFSLSGDYAYITALMNGFAEKKQINLNDRQKFMIRVWFLDNLETQYIVEKFYWAVEDYLKEIDVIAFDFRKGINAYFVSSKKEKLKEIKIKLHDGKIKIMPCKTVSIHEFKEIQLSSDVVVFYDPKKLCSLDNMGGISEKFS